MHVFDFEKVYKLGIIHAASLAIERLTKDDFAGFWIHLDVDVWTIRSCQQLIIA
jgi:arginase family enzyme